MRRLNVNVMAQQLFLFLVVVVVVVVLLLGFSQQVFSGSAVKYLPGLEGPLPFELETGYVGLGEEEQIQLFYYFIKSERDPEGDPVLLWLTGGPGCSAFSGLIYEIGPLNFKIRYYDNESLPELLVNKYSWTKASSVIFVDSPVGSGFSYAKNESAYQTGDMKQVSDLYQFLRKWLMEHPDFLHNEVYIGGDSYSGLIIPVLVQEIIKGNKAGEKPFTNIQGYVLGNPVTDKASDGNAGIPFAHGMGLISNELYQSLQENCKGHYLRTEFVSQQCSDDLDAYQQSLSGIQFSQILEPLCAFASRKPSEMFRDRRDLLENDFLLEGPIDLSCRTYGYALSPLWINDNNVREALHIRKGSIGSWQRCSTRFKYTEEISTVLQLHAELGHKGLRSLIYSGDHDLIVPFLGTQAWIRLLNYSIIDDWRSWMVEGQIAGYTRTYSNGMTFATVKGGGHTAPEYKPKECTAMYKRWVSREPL